MNADDIYDKEKLQPIKDTIKNCHIYLIGLTPIIHLVHAEQQSNILFLKYRVDKEIHSINVLLPEKVTLKSDNRKFYIEHPNGQRSWPSDEYIQTKLSNQTNSVNFEVKYIGQAYGKNGSRNAIDRLKSHETLQKIALKGIPEGYHLTLLLLSIQPNNQLYTLINPFAKNNKDSNARINSGVNKLYNTTEHERITLYEASLIRYFSPEFNKEFKDSFPCTNLKILQDCYDKDFSGIIAEICIDTLPFKLFTEKVKAKLYHIAKHDLHKNKNRRMFFNL
ncbi:hypothetical protein [Reinekea thalattae]|nr:hypothetical protein [Reinekea thalattae]